MKGPYFIPAEIIEFHNEIPYISLRIEEKSTLVKIDLGSDTPISLPREFVQELKHKALIRKDVFCGIRGKKYESDIYSISNVKIGRMVVFEPTAKETNLEFKKDATLVKNESGSVAPQGSIGWTLFHNFNFFLNCKNSLMAFCDSLDTLKNHGYDVDSFTEVPLLLDRGRIEFEAMTDSGTLRCLLDTGSTWNMLNKDIKDGSNDHMIFNQVTIDKHSSLNPKNADLMFFNPDDEYLMPVFKIGKKDFGAITFTKFKTPYEIDAIIGMEFIHSKLIFIDFPHRKIYFGEHDLNTKND
ncbi:MAG: hypothetical protein K2P51_07900 [Rhabdochlamydiaceae bacterium]|nr:hypothetical protein [Rhabdochlamydiaceae bacterium]